MKKLIKLCVVLILVGVAITGCKKEAPDAVKQVFKQDKIAFDPSLNIASDGRMLIFKTKADYERIANSPSGELRSEFLSKVAIMKHTTYGEKLASLNSAESKIAEAEDDTINDEFFNEIINEDKIVQIESKLYRVNVENEKVLVLPADKIEYYNDLVLEDESIVGIKRFSIADDVLDEVKDNEIAAAGCGGIGGGWYPSNIVNLDNDGQIKFDARVRFFRAGIFYRLTARCDYTPEFTGTVNLSLEVQNPMAWARKRPCNSGSVSFQPAGTKANGSFHSYVWEFYNASRNLNGYYLFARARASITKPGQPTVIKYTNWCGRNINSPY